MAFNVNGLLDYTSKATKILSDGLLYSDDFSEFDIQTGIKKTEDLNFLEADINVGPYSCDPTITGNTTITSKLITVTHFQNVSPGVCYTDLDGKLVGDNVPKVMTERIVNKLIADKENKLWNGDVATGMDGWVDWITTNSGDTIDAGFVSAITYENAGAAVDQLIANVSDAMWSRVEPKKPLIIYCSREIFSLYKNNRGDANRIHDDQNLAVWEMPVFKWNGQVKIKAVTPLTGNPNMFLTWGENLVIGVDELTNKTNGKWIEKSNLSDIVVFKADYKLGTQIHFEGEVVVLDVNRL